jgi:hypothetical protein
MFIVDQKSQGTLLGGDFLLGAPPLPVGHYSPAGQEFVPTAAQLNAVDLDLRTIQGTAGVASVRIRLDTMAGPIIGTSHTVPIGSTSQGSSLPFNPVRFDFPGPVPLEPGKRHVIEIVPIAGTLGVAWIYAQAGDSYPGGRCILSGQPSDVPWPVPGPIGGRASLWFQEGSEVRTPAGASWAAAVVYILFGVIQDGGGLGYQPGGKPVPIDPRRNLDPATWRALTGLAVHELASAIDDAEIQRVVGRAGLDLVHKAIRELGHGH